GACGVAIKQQTEKNFRRDGLATAWTIVGVYSTPVQLCDHSMIKFFVLDGLSSGVVAVSTDSAPDSAFAPSFFARPSGPLPSPIIRCSAGLARLKSSIMPSSRANPQWPGETDGDWQASPLRACLC